MEVRNLKEQLLSEVMTKEQIVNDINFIEAHIKEYGVDFTKKIINDIL